MEVIEIAGYLSDSVRKAKHKSAANMERDVRVIAEANDGKLASFEISKPGTALMFVIGDQAKQAVIREFKRLTDVIVSELPALTVQQEKNKKEQDRANRMRAAAAKRLAK